MRSFYFYVVYVKTIIFYFSNPLGLSHILGALLEKQIEFLTNINLYPLT